jgi:hypothetical protein
MAIITMERGASRRPFFFSFYFYFSKWSGLIRQVAGGIYVIYNE